MTRKQAVFPKHASRMVAHVAEDTNASVITALRPAAMELAAYLVALPRDTLDALYESRWTCLAVLRSLPPLGSQYLLRMLLVDAPVTQGAHEDCVRDERDV